MFTNTYAPILGGLERSVQVFCEEFARRGHAYRIVTPEFDGELPEPDGERVLRVPSIKKVGDTAFSFRLPIPGLVTSWMDAFGPDIIHSHNPFMLGDTALRVALRRRRPLVFTHHTLLERYAHYIAEDSESVRRMAMRLSVEYANLCDAVIAPSNSIHDILRERGVDARIEVIPTGIDVEAYTRGDREGFRRRHGLGEKDFVFGHLGRLTREKNLDYIGEAALRAVRELPQARFLLVGEGERAEAVQGRFQEAGLANRLVFPGKLSGSDVADAFASMDVFLFASHTDTQGIVLAEALAAGCPVIALDAPGARDAVRDGYNGRLLPGRTPASGMAEILQALPAQRAELEKWTQGAKESARTYDRSRCAEQMLAVYADLLGTGPQMESETLDGWELFASRLEAEWALLREKWGAAKAFVGYE